MGLPLFDISIDHDIGNTVKSLQKQYDFLNAVPLDQLAQEIINYLVDRIEEGNKFKPLSRLTLHLRSRRGRGGTKPLLVTENLKDSIKVLSSHRNEVEIGSRLPYAAFQRSGGVTASDSMIPGRKVPARDFLRFECKKLDDAVCNLLKRYEKSCG